MSLRTNQSSVAILNHKNVTLVNFCKRQSSKNMCMLQDNERCRQGALVRTNDAFPKEKNIFSRDLPGTLDSSDRQVSVQGLEGFKLTYLGLSCGLSCVFGGVFFFVGNSS